MTEFVGRNLLAFVIERSAVSRPLLEHIELTQSNVRELRENALDGYTSLIYLNPLETS